MEPKAEYNTTGAGSADGRVSSLNKALTNLLQDAESASQRAVKIADRLFGEEPLIRSLQESDEPLPGGELGHTEHLLQEIERRLADLHGQLARLEHL
jgi:hypothetical protein